jgi:hypothetical protein
MGKRLTAILPTLYVENSLLRLNGIVNAQIGDDKCRILIHKRNYG